MSEEKIHKMIDSNSSFVIRLRSRGTYIKREVWNDEIKGKIEMPENDSDIVLLKADGYPTYHFAHVVDDHLMRTTHVIRGDEWLSSVPIHLELFRAFNWSPPVYAHIAPIEKEECLEGYVSRRKLSKRKDPEASIEYYLQQGFPEDAIIKYLLNLMDSSFLAWQAINPANQFNEFTFSMKKLSKHGALHDIDKLKNISQDVISRMDGETLYHNVLKWACEWDAELSILMKKYPAYTRHVLNIERNGSRPSKRFTTWSDVRPQIFFMYDELFNCERERSFPENISSIERTAIVSDFIDNYKHELDKNDWMTLLKKIATTHNYAESIKDYKCHPERYNGHFGDVAMLLRIGVCGVSYSPDLREVMRLLGYERVVQRLGKLCDSGSSCHINSYSNSDAK